MVLQCDVPDQLAGLRINCVNPRESVREYQYGLILCFGPTDVSGNDGAGDKAVMFIHPAFTAGFTFQCEKAMIAVADKYRVFGHQGKGPWCFVCEAIGPF